MVVTSLDSSGGQTPIPVGRATSLALMNCQRVDISGFLRLIGTISCARATERHLHVIKLLINQTSLSRHGLNGGKMCCHNFGDACLNL